MPRTRKSGQELTDNSKPVFVDDDQLENGLLEVANSVAAIVEHITDEEFDAAESLIETALDAFEAAKVYLTALRAQEGK